MAENGSIDRLQIEISSSSASAVRSIKNLTGALEKMRGALSEGLNSNQLVKDIKDISDGLNNLSGIDKLKNIGDALRGFRSLSGVMRQLDKTPTMLSAIYGFMSGIAGLNFSNMRDFSAAMSSINSAKAGLAGAAKAAERLGNTDKQISSTAKSVKEVGDEAKKSSSKMSELLLSLKRIAMYRLIRTVIKGIGQAFKEGLENAYEYSKLVGGELAPALDRIATASAQMKNQMGAAFGQILQLLEPLIVQLIHLVTKLAQAFTWLFALLSGSDTYLVANEVATSWKEADKAAKGYRNTLIGIDEINRLNDPNGGGGKTTPNYGDMFHYEPTNFKLPDITAWAVPFMDTINGALALVAELAHALVTLPSPEVNVNVDRHGATEAVEGLRTIFKPLLQGSPYIVTCGVSLLGNPVGVIQALADAIGVLLTNSPYIVEIKNYIESPVPALEAITARVKELAAEQEVAMSSAYERADSSILSSLAKAGQYLKDGLINMKNTVNVWGPDFAASCATAFMGIATGMNPGIIAGRDKIHSFLRDTLADFNTFGMKVSEIFQKVWESITGFATSAKETFDKIKDSTAWKILFGESKASFPSVSGTMPIVPFTPVLVPAFASGGFVDSGELYLAREAGPELVGSIGNHTAVANNDQIVEGISEGVSYANSGVIGAINQLIAVVQQIDPTIELDGLKVSRELHKYNRQVTREAGQSLAVEVMA